MKQSTITLLILLAPVVWLLLRPKLSTVRTRLRLAAQVALVGYFALLALRLYQMGVDENQVLTAAASILVFGGVWVIVWLVTSRMDKSR